MRSGANLYVHFPFCRAKCAYCALHSRPGASVADRSAYVATLAERVRTLGSRLGVLSTVYFGGGTPALCDLSPILDALAPHVDGETEFTVELHPLDVSDELLGRLADGGVNRISMGVQSLEDAVLAAMGRGYSAGFAARAFGAVRKRFEDAGIDLIVGYPGESDGWQARIVGLGGWGLAHCSAYALQNERNLADVPDDAVTMDRLASVAEALESIGLKRYEISNYAVSGRECRHNMAVWRGEDYYGLGEGAHGRIGRLRTVDYMGPHESVETVDAATDNTERRIFRLRTREGLDASGRGEWIPVLDRFADEGLLRREGAVYWLTARGAEVCDTILSEIA